MDIFACLHSPTALKSYLSSQTDPPPDVNALNRDGAAPLHVAAAIASVAGSAANALSVAELLLHQYNVRVDVQDIYGNAPLHIAANTDNLPLAELLLSAGANPTMTNLDGHAPIAYAKTSEMEKLLSEHTANTRPNSWANPDFDTELSQVERELAYDAALLKSYVMVTLKDEQLFRDRCREALRQQIEEKQMALHKTRLLERAAGINDRQIGKKFTDQLQYWQDENEKQAATIAYLRIKIRMFENTSNSQDEFFRKNLQDLAEQHNSQLQTIYRRCKEAEDSFSNEQKTHAKQIAELAVVKAELRDLKLQKATWSTRGSGSEETATGAEIKLLKTQIAEAEKKNAEYGAELAAVQERMKLAEKLKLMTESENADLRSTMSKLRKSIQDDLMVKLNEARTFQDDQDEFSGAVVFSKGMSGTKQIKAATREKLVERLTDGTTYDNQFLQAFMLTFRVFMSKQDLLDGLIRKYKDSTFGSDDFVAAQNPVHLRICNTLKYWMENYWPDFEDLTLRENVTRFILFLTERNEKLAVLLQSILTRKMTGTESVREQKTGKSAKPKPILPKYLIKKYTAPVPATLNASMSASFNGINPLLSASSMSTATISAGDALVIPPSNESASAGNKEKEKEKDEENEKENEKEGENENEREREREKEREKDKVKDKERSKEKEKENEKEKEKEKDREKEEKEPEKEKDKEKDKEREKGTVTASTWTPFNFKVRGVPEEEDKVKLIKFTDVDPLEIARQLTLVEFELFTAIKTSEFLDQAWMKEDRLVKAPNICKMTRWTNHVIHWVVTEIVTLKDLKSRAAVYERYIVLAQHLEKMNNFNGTKEILAGLQSSSVYRLKKTRESVGQKYLKVLDDLTRDTSSEMNFKSLRAKVHAAEPPLIPFPGVYQSDLVFLDTCSKSFLDGGLVNFYKFQKIASYILELQVYQQTPFSFEGVAEIQEYIRDFKVFDDEDSYSHSLLCEPRA